MNISFEYSAICECVRLHCEMDELLCSAKKILTDFKLDNKVSGIVIHYIQGEEATLYHPHGLNEIVRIDVPCVHPKDCFDFYITHELLHLRDQFDPHFGWDESVNQGKSKGFRRTLNEIWDITVDIRMGNNPDQGLSIEDYEVETGDDSIFNELIENPNISFPEMIKIVEKLELFWEARRKKT